jgi:hypothetical protein
MDPLHISIALGPLAVYLLLLGMINLSTRPFLTTGARDTAALGVAISGFIVAGPMQLFLPHAAAERFGGFVWVLLLAFFTLCLSLTVLLIRPRLVIYNASVDQLHSIISGVVSKLDHETRWAGDNLIMPNLGIQLTVESFSAMKNAQLIANGSSQSYEGWRRLELALAEALRDTKSSRNPYGYSLLLFGFMMVGIVTFWMVSDPETVAQSLREMLRL